MTVRVSCRMYFSTSMKDRAISSTEVISRSRERNSRVTYVRGSVCFTRATRAALALSVNAVFPSVHDLHLIRACDTSAQAVQTQTFHVSAVWCECGGVCSVLREGKSLFIVS